MSIKRIFLLLFILIVQENFSQKNKVLYLDFNPNIKKSCTNSNYINGDSIKKVDYVDFFSEGYFVLCNQYFKIKANTIIREFTKESFKQIPLNSIQDFINIKNKVFKEKIQDLNLQYKNIYIVLKNADDKYFIFEVEWKDYYIDHNDPLIKKPR